MGCNIIGLGTAAMDIVLNCEELPREDGFSFINREVLTPGGSCANVLVALSVLGHRPGLVARMGDDHFGKQFIEDLAQSGVSADYVRTKPGGTSLHTYITVAANGAKSIFAHLGDSLLELSEEDVEIDWLENVQVYYTDMFPAGAALKMARESRKRNIPVLINLQTSIEFMDLCGITRRDIDEMLSLADLFITSREGLHELTSDSDPASSCRNFLDNFSNLSGVIATLGENGASWISREEAVSAPVFPVQAVDTTGAGDAFIAGIIHSYLIGKEPKQRALKVAQACAAMKCTIPGPRLTASPEEIRRFIDSCIAGDTD